MSEEIAWAAEITAQRQRIAALEADAAALAALVRDYGEHRHDCGYWWHEDCNCYLAPALAADHPGAALLAEIAAARAAYEQARQIIRALAFAVENVLDGAEIDDGIVHVSALTRLDEEYERTIRPLGPSRMPPALAAYDAARKGASDAPD